MYFSEKISFMKPHWIYSILVMISVFLFRLQAGENTAKQTELMAYKLASSSSLVIEGTSTLHDYSIDVKDMTGTLSLISTNRNPEINLGKMDPISIVTKGGLGSIKADFPVSGFNSGKNKMDQNIRKAMEADQFPTVLFNLSSYNILDFDDNIHGVAALLTGRLSISGVERSIDFPVRITPKHNTITVQGQKDLLMSDYGVRPPVFLFGTVKTDDKISVHFDLGFEKIQSLSNTKFSKQ
jgi:hypothetical protein